MSVWRGVAWQCEAGLPIGLFESFLVRKHNTLAILNVEKNATFERILAILPNTFKIAINLEPSHNT